MILWLFSDQEVLWSARKKRAKSSLKPARPFSRWLSQAPHSFTAKLLYFYAHFTGCWWQKSYLSRERKETASCRCCHRQAGQAKITLLYFYIDAYFVENVCNIIMISYAHSVELMDHSTLFISLVLSSTVVSCSLHG